MERMAAAMSGKVRIGAAEAVYLCVVFIISKIFLSYQLPILDAAQTAAWLAVLIASLAGGLLFYWSLVPLLKQHPGKNIVEIGEELAGPVINSFFCLGYLLFFLVLTALVLRQFSERVITSFVEEMPISFAVFSFAAGMVIVTYLGLEAIARTARVFAPILLLMFLFLIVSTIPYWEYQHIYPLLGAGAPALASTSLLKTGLLSEIFILAVLNHALPERRLAVIAMASLSISAFFLVIGVLAVLMVFPFTVFAELTLPTFELAKMIYLGRFLQRLETLFVPVWAFGGLIKLTVGLYSAAFIAAAMLKLPYYRPLIPALTVIIIALAFIPGSAPETVRWDNDYLRNYGWLALFAPLAILALLSGLRNKKGGKKEGG